jgi:hypothetical protein
MLNVNEQGFDLAWRCRVSCSSLEEVPDFAPELIAGKTVHRDMTSTVSPWSRMELGLKTSGILTEDLQMKDTLTGHRPPAGKNDQLVVRQVS